MYVLQSCCIELSSTSSPDCTLGRPVWEKSNLIFSTRSKLRISSRLKPGINGPIKIKSSENQSQNLNLIGPKQKMGQSGSSVDFLTFWLVQNKKWANQVAVLIFWHFYWSKTKNGPIRFQCWFSDILIGPKQKMGQSGSNVDFLIHSDWLLAS